MSTGQRRWILSGGLASGKSLVRQMLADRGVLTIDADQVGHGVSVPDGPAFHDVAQRWPGVVVEGRIDRQALAALVFNDAAQLRELETITHPHIFDAIRARVEGIEGPVVVEIPLLSRSLGPGWGRVVVDARDEVRFQRAIGRGMDEADARARMAAQPSRSEWLAASDVVIPNHEALQDLEQTVSELVSWL